MGSVQLCTLQRKGELFSGRVCCPLHGALPCGACRRMTAAQKARQAARWGPRRCRTCVPIWLQPVEEGTCCRRATPRSACCDWKRARLSVMPAATRRLCCHRIAFAASPCLSRLRSTEDIKRPAFCCVLVLMHQARQLGTSVGNGCLASAALSRDKRPLPRRLVWQPMVRHGCCAGPTPQAADTAFSRIAAHKVNTLTRRYRDGGRAAGMSARRPRRR